MPNLVAGVDASAMQGIITGAQWAELRRTAAWALLRVMQGLGGVDSTFFPNLAGARGAGMIAVGGYFVFVPGLDPAAQARAWVLASRGLGAGTSGRTDELPMAIDFEIASKTLTPEEEVAAVVVTVETLEALCGGRSPFLYTYRDFWRREVLAVATPAQLAVFARCLLWFAAYAAAPPPPPKPWGKVTLWQASGGDRVKTPGGAPMDGDYFLGTEDELRQLASFSPALGPNPLAGVPVPGLIIPGENDDEGNPSNT